MSAADATPGKPRLLVLASTYPRWRDDPEPAFVHELAKRLVDRFEVTVLCPHAAGALVREDFDGVRVIRYRYAPERLETLVNDGGIVANLRRSKWKLLLAPGFVLAQWWVARRLVRAGEVDVMHAHWILPQGLVAAMAAQARRGPRVPFLVTSHGADLFALRGWFAQQMKRWVLKRAAATTVVSEGMRAPMLALGADPATLRVESMGVDLQGRFTPDASVERSENEILFVGRLVEKKGLRHLIDAMPHVIAAQPDAFLTVVGFGPELDARRKQVARLGLERQVRFHGPIAQGALPGFYRRAALFVAPFVESGEGDQEGLGLVVLEAAGCGCRVVVSEMVATRAFIGASPRIRVVQWQSPEELAEAVTPARLAPIANRGELDSFDWSSRAKAYAGLLSHLRSALP